MSLKYLLIVIFLFSLPLYGQKIKDNKKGIAIWHPNKVNERNIVAKIKDVPVNHECITKPKKNDVKPNRIVGDYEFVDDSSKKIEGVYQKDDIMLEICFTNEDFENAGNKLENLILYYWDINTLKWKKFTRGKHGFEIIFDQNKYPGYLGYARISKNVPLDPPIGWER
ncbi:MAG: hypothetical protein JW866_06155 [Ignavibacteriales bacterium]|nr:hypothetical protein [Ignavibacteriales bacterium]